MRRTHVSHPRRSIRRCASGGHCDELGRQLSRASRHRFCTSSCTGCSTQQGWRAANSCMSMLCNSRLEVVADRLGVRACGHLERVGAPGTMPGMSVVLSDSSPLFRYLVLACVLSTCIPVTSVQNSEEPQASPTPSEPQVPVPPPKCPFDTERDGLKCTKSYACSNGSRTDNGHCERLPTDRGRCPNGMVLIPEYHFQDEDYGHLIVPEYCVDYEGATIGDFRKRLRLKSFTKSITHKNMSTPRLRHCFYRPDPVRMANGSFIDRDNVLCADDKEAKEYCRSRKTRLITSPEERAYAFGLPLTWGLYCVTTPSPR